MREVISLAMIVRNEAARLPACLASVVGAVDEMVVVDTGSTDGTPDIARAHGARVVEWAWRDDFAAARNEALAHARGDWVLSLDADERLAPGDDVKLRALVARGDADGFDCQLVSRLPADQPSAVIAHWYCRLFRRREGVRFEGRIHEQIAPSILATGGRISRSDLTILHEGYAEVSAEKVARNLSLLRLELAERPGHAFTLFSLGLTLQSAGLWDEGARALERALAATLEPLPRRLRSVAWMKIAETRFHAGEMTPATAAAEEALAAEPDLALARYTLGRALFARGAVEAAGILFEELADAPADALGMVLHPHLVAIARALVMLRQRRWADALEVLAPVAADDTSGEAMFQLGNTYLGLGRLGEAAAAYTSARHRGVEDPALERRLELCSRLQPVAELAGAARR